jgi:hypothetical protein
MADQVIVKPKSESTETSASLGQENQATNASRSQALILCAAGLGISFFLPWANFFGATLSGFDLQKMGDQHRLLWLIPILSVITIVAGITKRSQYLAGQLTAILPFCVGFYWYSKLGKDIQHILTYGAYLSLLFGAGLAVLSKRLK